MISKVFLPKRYELIKNKKELPLSYRRLEDNIEQNFFNINYLYPLILILLFLISLPFLKISSPFKYYILAVTIISLLLLPNSLKGMIKKHKKLNEKQKKINHNNSYLKGENDTLKKYQNLILKYRILNIFEKLDFLEKAKFLNKNITILKNSYPFETNYQIFFLYFLNYFYGNRISHGNYISFGGEDIKSDYFYSYSNTGVFINIIDDLNSNSNIKNKFEDTGYAYIAFCSYEILNYPIECCLLISEVIREITGKQIENRFYSLNFPFCALKLKNNSFFATSIFNLYDYLKLYPFLKINKGDILVYRKFKDSIATIRHFPREIKIDEGLDDYFRYNNYYKINLSECTLGEPLWNNLKLEEWAMKALLQMNSFENEYSSKKLSEETSKIADEEFDKLLSGEYWENSNKHSDNNIQPPAEDLEMIPFIITLND